MVTLAWPMTSTRSPPGPSCCRPIGSAPAATIPRPIIRRSSSWCARAIPKNIRDWNDLARPGVKVITPNPKTSGGARWNFLAAWGYGQKSLWLAARRARLCRPSLHNVPILDSGARAATVNFAERGLGDVLITWENEAILATRELGAGRFEIVVPSITIRAEPPVAVVDKIVDRRGTRKQAEAYLRFLYTPEAQEIIARNGYRPIDPDVAARHAERFPRCRCSRSTAISAAGRRPRRLLRRRRHLRPDLRKRRLTA